MNHIERSQKRDFHSAFAEDTSDDERASKQFRGDETTKKIYELKNIIPSNCFEASDIKFAAISTVEEEAVNTILTLSEEVPLKPFPYFINFNGPIFFIQNAAVQFYNPQNKGFITFCFMGLLILGIYEGPVLDDKPHGQGKLFDCINDLKFEGTFQNGSPEGNGKIYYGAGKLFFEGEMSKGKQGEGTFFTIDGKVIYKGKVLNVKRSGHGISYSSEGKKIYEGNWEDGFFHKFGRQYFPNGNIQYIGEFSYGLRHGKGTLYDDLGNLLEKGTYCYHNLINPQTPQVHLQFIDFAKPPKPHK